LGIYLRILYHRISGHPYMTATWVVTLLVLCSAAVTGQTLTGASPTLIFPGVDPGSPYAPQSFTLSATNGANVAFTHTISTSNGGAWLTAQLAQNTTPALVQVAVNTAGLAAGTYAGAIAFSAAGLGSFTEIVQLTVPATSSTSSAFNLSTNLVSITRVVGSESTSELLFVSSTSPLFYRTAASTTTGGNWLFAHPPGFGPATNGILSVLVIPAGLSAGTYFGTMEVSAGETTRIVIVTLTLTAPPVGPFSLSPVSVQFTFAQGNTPQSKSVLFTPNTPMLFTAAASTTSGGNWLNAHYIIPEGPVGNYGISLYVNSAGLLPGVYFGSLQVTAAGTTQTIPVTATVLVAQPTLTAAPAQLSFRARTGGPAASQTLTVSGTADLAYTVAATAQAGNWLTAIPSNGSLPGAITVTANPAGLTAGTHTGSVLVTSSGQPQTIPVTLTVVQETGLASFVPNVGVSLAYNIGEAALSVATVSLVAAQDVAFTLSPFTTSGTNWLTVTPTSGTAGTQLQQVSITINPIGLPAGTHSGQIQTVAGGQLLATLPVTLTVSGSSGSVLTVTPPSLGFSASPGDTTAIPRTLVLSAPTPTSYTVSIADAGSWLRALGNFGNITTVSTFGVSAHPAGLAQGTYTAAISIVPLNAAPVIVPVSITIGSGGIGGLNITPSELSFSMQPGGALPAVQVLEIGTPTSAVVQVAANGASNGNPWLTATPAVGQTQAANSSHPARAAVAVSIVNSQLVAGRYNGTITVSAAGLGPVVIPVTLSVGSILITTANLPLGSVEQEYRHTLAASGGTGGYTWSITSGALPAGLTLNASTGAIAGKLTILGTFPFRVKVTDSSGAFATAQFSLRIEKYPSLATTRLPGGLVNSVYNASVQAVGGEPPYTFRAGLPLGWTMNPATGAISGQPASAGTFGATVTVTDSANNTSMARYPFIIQRNAAQSPKLSYVPLAPCRLMETRAEYNFEGRTGSFGPPFVGRGETRSLTVSSSAVCPIPASARALVLNVTLIPRAPVDFVTVYPGDEDPPEYWTVRSLDQQIVANSAIVRVGGDRTVRVFSSGEADVLIDVSGYFTDSTAQPNLVFYPVTPCRAVETRIDYRSPAGPFGPPSLNAAETRRFRMPAAPGCSIPANAAAYSATVTVVPPGPLAYLTAWPAGTAQPNVSSINSFAGRVLANNLIIPAGADGAIDVFAYDRTDVIVDINGYFAPDDGVNGLYFYPLVQCRIADSTGTAYSGAFGEPIYNDETTRTLPIRSSPQCVSIPVSAKAYAVNVTAIPNGSPMPFLTAWPTGQPRPNASILNAFQGQTVSNSALIPAGVDGSIDIFAFRRTHVVVEVSGYFGR
jgi:hypothetical protein